MTDYRKIWSAANGPIPIDENGVTFEIHHIDGDRTNNHISNLKCVSIEEHYNIHLNQGDVMACAAISKRASLTLNDREKLSKLISERNKSQIGDKNPFFGCHHTDETKRKQSERMSGENHPFYGVKRLEHSEQMKSIGFGKNKSKEHLDNHAKSWIESTKNNPIRSKVWNVKTPDGIVTIKNLKKFCRDNDLPYLQVYNGNHPEYQRCL